jgi:hypothetical protein
LPAGRFDEIEDRNACRGPAAAGRNGARRVATHHDRLRAGRFQERDVRAEEANEVVVVTIAVRHVGLIGQVDDVFVRQSSPHAPQDGQPAETGVEDSENLITIR